MPSAVEVANAYVALTAKMPGIERDISTALGAADGEFEKAGKRQGGLFGKIVGGSMLGSLGADAIKSVVSSISSFVQGSVTAYKEAESAQVALTDAYNRFPAAASVTLQSYKDLNAAIMAKTRFDDDALASSQATLAQYGLTGQQLQQLTPLLADYAAKTGQDVTTAADQLGKAMLGQGRALKAVGIDFVDTGSVAGNFEQVMAGLNTQVAGFAETEGQSAAGMAARMSNAFGELKENIGAALMPVLLSLGNAFLTYVMPVLSKVVDFVTGNMGPAMDMLSSLFANVDVSGLSGILPFLSPLGIVFQVLGDVLPQVAGSLGETVGIIGGALGNAVQAVLPTLTMLVQMIADLAAQVLPMVLPLVTILAQLFADVLTAVMPLVQTLIGALGPILAAIIPLVTSLLGAFMPLITVLVQALAPILTVVANILNAVLTPVLTAVTWVVQLVAGAITWLAENILPMLAAAATWLWETILKPVFDAIGAVVTWVWETIIMPVVDAVVAYFQLWGAVATWLWDTVLKPVFDAIGAVFTWIWETVISPIVGFIAAAIQGLGIVFDWLYTNIIKPVWDGISATISAVWTWIDQNVFTPFKTGIDLLGQAFQNVAAAIGIAWDGIKQAAAAPINFVLDTVWNKGLRSFWNDLVTNLGLTDMQLPEAALVQFASGGVLPGYTPGRDVHRFWSPTAGGLALSGGEAIMRPEFTRAVGGPAGVDALNAAAIRGEIGDGFGDFAGDVWENIQKAASVAWEFITDPAGAVQRYVVDGIINPLMSGQNMFGQTVGGLAIKTVKDMAGMFSSAAPSMRGGQGMGWEAMWKVVSSRFPWANLNSAYYDRIGGTTYHGKGRAIDVTPSMEIFNWLRSAFPNSSELIYSPAGGRQLLNGQDYFWGEPVRSQHFNHVHWAMAHGGVVPKLYDSGGWLPHGGMAVNLSGRPEAVLSPAESEAYAARGRTQVVQNITLRTDDPRLAVRQMGREAERAFSSS